MKFYNPFQFIDKNASKTYISPLEYTKSVQYVEKIEEYIFAKTGKGKRREFDKQNCKINIKNL